MNCNKIRENLSDAIDNELPDSLRDFVNEHLAYCAECRYEHARLTKAAGLVHTMEIPQAPSHVFSNVLASIKQEDVLRKSYQVFAGLLSFFALLAAVLVIIIASSPLGSAIIALINAVVRNILDIVYLLVKTFTRLPLGVGEWSISLSLFLGFWLAFFALRKILFSSNLGGPLHE